MTATLPCLHELTARFESDIPDSFLPGLLQDKGSFRMLFDRADWILEKVGMVGWGIAAGSLVGGGSPAALAAAYAAFFWKRASDASDTMLQC